MLGDAQAARQRASSVARESRPRPFSRATRRPAVGANGAGRGRAAAVAGDDRRASLPARATCLDDDPRRGLRGGHASRRHGRRRTARVTGCSCASSARRPVSRAPLPTRRWRSTALAAEQNLARPRRRDCARRSARHLRRPPARRARGGSRGAQSLGFAATQAEAGALATGLLAPRRSRLPGAARRAGRAVAESAVLDARRTARSGRRIAPGPCGGARWRASARLRSPRTSCCGAPVSSSASSGSCRSSTAAVSRRPRQARLRDPGGDHVPRRCRRRVSRSRARIAAPRRSRHARARRRRSRPSEMRSPTRAGADR